MQEKAQGSIEDFIRRVRAVETKIELVGTQGVAVPARRDGVRRCGALPDAKPPITPIPARRDWRALSKVTNGSSTGKPASSQPVNFASITGTPARFGRLICTCFRLARDK